MLIDTGSLITLSEWTIRIAALVVVPQRRAPAAARGWLLLILFVPFAGLALYLLIGRPAFPAWRQRRAETMAALRQETPPDGTSGATPDGAEGPASEIAHLASAVGAWPPVAGNGLTFHPDYEECITHIIADIDAASHSVDLLAYIFASDRIGERVAAALRRAGERGVRCRVLFDPVGSARWRSRTQALLRDSGASYRQALPLRILRGFTRRDLRNHRKLYLIDGLTGGGIGWIGSQNIVAPDFRPGVVNRELMVRARGPLVAQMQLQFETDWHLESGGALPLPLAAPEAGRGMAGTAVAQLLPSGPDFAVEGFQSLLVWQLHRAMRRVVIVTPYFIPDTDLLAALRTALLRGVEVDLLLSHVMDQPLVGLAQRSFYAELLAMGVNIHRFPHYLLHAKNLVIDDHLAVVGSSNIDIRSFQLNLELNLLLLDAASVAGVATIQQAWLAESEPLRAEDWNRRPFVQRVVENIARLFDSLI